MSTTSEFRIYVASLSDYNNGCLHGAWLDLDDYSDIEDLQEAVTAMFAKSPFDNSDFTKTNGLLAKEYVILDYEGFPQSTLGEHSGISDVWELWEEFEQAEKDDNVEAFKTYRECFDGDYKDFQERYRGRYDSEAAFAEELLDDTGELNAIPENLRYYFDYEAYARDLFCGAFTMQDGYVFWNY